MSSLLALSIVTAVLCGIWSVLSAAIGMIGWAGFAGCTTYFSCGRNGIAGLKKTILPNIAGVVCGMAMISLGNSMPVLGAWGIWCAVLTFVMCIAARWEVLDFCPGTFMGCFSTFAANGNWKILIPSLVLGAFLGLACDCGGKWLYKTLTKET